jgi:two-component sensor histidine kinase
VKNNLQAVSSLVQLQPIPAELRRAMSSRIAAMVGLHEHLYNTDQYERVQLDDYLSRLLSDLAVTYQASVRIDKALEPVAVARDQAMPIGLIVNEVVSNALKYAFPDGRSGTISVRLMREGEDRLCLVIADDGVGFAPDGVSPGMGTRLIEGFVGQLGGTHRFEAGHGTVFTLVFAAVTA